MVAESWFRNVWKLPRKNDGVSEKVAIGVLTFEVASLMSKLVHMWQSLGEKQVARLREEIANSVGIEKLVSDDEKYIAALICEEMVENTGCMAKSVARLAQKCKDPNLKNFELIFGEWMKIGTDPYRWLFTWKEMDKKVKKMEYFISVNASLYQEMELLGDLEQTLKRMKSTGAEHASLVEYQKKVACKQHVVRSLQDLSPWNKTYDYMVCLFAGSLFTILGRIKHVFGSDQAVNANEPVVADPDFSYHSQSVSALMKSSVHPSENSSFQIFSSGPLKRFTMKSGLSSGPISRTAKTNYFHSGPLNNSTTKPDSTNGNAVFYSGPLTKTKTESIAGTYKTSKKKWWSHAPSPFRQAKKAQPRSHQSSEVVLGRGNVNLQISCQQKNSLLKTPPPETLGAEALALHYANVIIVIEKLVASPHLIGHDARDDLYNMLPASVRSSLRARLKPYSKSLSSSDYDPVLAREWTDAMAAILEWLAPLAHNMIRWQSERSFEQQSCISRTNVLLVQTLYFANLEKTEATITELLVGLNYVWRLDREVTAKTLQKTTGGSSVFESYFDQEP